MREVIILVWNTKDLIYESFPHGFDDVIVKKGDRLYCFATVVKKMKAAALHQAMSDEELVRDYLSPLVDGCHIRNKNKDPFDLNKARVSLLLAQTAEVPKALRDGIRIVDAENKVIPGMHDFIANTLASNRLVFLMNSIIELAEEDRERLTAEEVKGLRECSNQPEVFFTRSLFLAIQVSNQVKQNIHIWCYGSFNLTLDGYSRMSQNCSNSVAVRYSSYSTIY